MLHNFLRLAATVAFCAISIGCSNSRDTEQAKIRAELDKLKSENAQLRAEIAQLRGGGQQPDAAKKQTNAVAKVLVVRGLKLNWYYPIYEGRNVIGRADEKPVDIDLQPQEPQDRIWSSRQHAVITCMQGKMEIEDLNSANGTYLNGKRVPPGEKRALADGDIIQIGAVQLKVQK